AERHSVDVIGLSGLITPSLDEMVGVARAMKNRGMNLPLIIGGATTSRIHTAVKIDPNYESPVVHILDASRAVTVCTDLLKDSKLEFAGGIKAEYSKLRDDHANRTQKKNYLGFEDAKSNRTEIDWDSSELPKPKVTGTKVLDDVDLNKLREFIDWTPFFKTWMLTGKHPAILEDDVVGEQATELLKDANELLDRIIQDKSLKAKAVIGLYPAAADGEDVLVFEDESKNEIKTKFHFIRQQAEKRSGQPNSSLVDYIAPLNSGRLDHIGFFAVTAGLGIEKLLEEYKNDDYKQIMVKALADRLAEASAEYMHYKVRTDFWGYSTDEQFTNEELISEDYQGIRPAPGYPACPDHTEKRTLFDLLEVEKNIGISLTESCAMYPASSVSGFYFSHPQSRYFRVGKIEKDQIEDYAKRKGQSIEETEKWLAPYLAYN
ncbi:MAG: vitamin B12 dependent-methionine synthase activation domain-containing protein, partial [Balneola sp.]